MKKLRVYIDTSVFGGWFDPEFSRDSRAFFKKVISGHLMPLLSATLLRELEEAPKKVRDLFARILRAEAKTIEVTPEMVD